MATLTLKNIKKIYPHSADEGKKKKKKKNENWNYAPLRPLEKYGIMCTSRWIMPTPQK